MGNVKQNVLLHEFYITPINCIITCYLFRISAVNVEQANVAPSVSRADEIKGPTKPNAVVSLKASNDSISNAQLMSKELEDDYEL
jgi:hypothetical protein